MREAKELARSTRSERAFVVCATLHAAVLSEVGRTDEMWAAIAEARAAAQEQRIDCLWQGGPGRWCRCSRRSTRRRTPSERASRSTCGGPASTTRRAVYAERGAPLEHDNDISLPARAHAAELALYLGEPALAAGAYARLAPLAGLNTCAGSSLALGPVDSYLAPAAAATGERDLAAKHADAALALAEAWEVPRVASWLRGLRDEHGF